MSGLEVVGCIAAVVSAFHGGAELVKAIKKKHKKRKDVERDFQEKQLQESLEQGEKQVSVRYCAEYDVFGYAFRAGDGIAIAQLLQIAVSMQAEIIRSLQIADEFENAILDLTRLHEASVTSKHDTMNSLNHLRERILVSLPIEAPIGNGSIESASTGSRGSILSYMTANAVSPDMVPAAVTLSAGPERQQGLGRYLSVKSSGRPRSNSGASRISLAPSFAWLTPLIQAKELDMRLFGQQQAAGGDDESERESIRSRFDSIISDKGMQRPSMHRHPSSASGSSSVYSAASARTPDTLVSPTLTVSTFSPFQQTPSLPSPLPSPLQSPLQSPTSPQRPQRPDMNHYRALSIQQQQRLSDSQQVHPALRPSLPPPPVPAPATSTAPAQRMHGRPEKSNNYWGFCKGAWSTRESIKSGLTICMVPNGLYGQTPYWRCKTCQFRTQAVGPKKLLPDAVYRVSCGIRYKWLFLARSHVKCENPTATREEYSYGCMFCSVEGRETGVYGDVDTLMAHIDMKHVAALAGNGEMLRRTKCVLGRVPERNEEWDIHIPSREARPVELEGGSEGLQDCSGV